MKVLIADDHPIIRKGVTEILLHEFSGSEVVHAKNGEETIRLLDDSYAIVFLDIDMPQKDGLEVCKVIREENYSCKIIFLTLHDNPQILHRAAKLKADGFLLKESSTEEIIICINVVLTGQQFTNKKIREILIDSNKRKKEIELNKGLQELTKTEKKVLQLVAESFSSKEIALRLFVTPKSVKNYRHRISRKLNLDPKNNSLSNWAIENKEIIKILLF